MGWSGSLVGDEVARYCSRGWSGSCQMVSSVRCHMMTCQDLLQTSAAEPLCVLRGSAARQKIRYCASDTLKLHCWCSAQCGEKSYALLVMHKSINVKGMHLLNGYALQFCTRSIHVYIGFATVCNLKALHLCYLCYLRLHTEDMDNISSQTSCKIKL